MCFWLIELLLVCFLHSSYLRFWTVLAMVSVCVNVCVRVHSLMLALPIPLCLPRLCLPVAYRAQSGFELEM